MITEEDVQRPIISYLYDKDDNLIREIKGTLTYLSGGSWRIDYHEVVEVRSGEYIVEDYLVTFDAW